MEPTGSVTRWLSDLKGGDAEAARRLWERYFGRLVRLMSDRLRGAGCLGADHEGEDVALSALNSICSGATAGRFARLDDRDDLWRLLVTIAARKAANLVRDRRRLKRGGGRVQPETDLAASDPDEGAVLVRVVGDEPSPEFAAIVAEEFERRLDSLRDDVLRRIALMRLEGFGNDEIAERLGCTTRTVTRKLDVIRRHWSAGAAP